MRAVVCPPKNIGDSQTGLRDGHSKKHALQFGSALTFKEATTIFKYDRVVNLLLVSVVL